MCRNELFSSAGNQGQRACSVLFWPDRQTVPTRFLSGLLYKALGSNSLPKTFDGITKTLDPKTEKPRADSDGVDQISCRKLTSATDRWNVSIKLGCTWSALRLWDFLTPLRWTALLKRCSTETEGEPKYNKTILTPTLLDRHRRPEALDLWFYVCNQFWPYFLKITAGIVAEVEPSAAFCCWSSSASKLEMLWVQRRHFHKNVFVIGWGGFLTVSKCDQLATKRKETTGTVGGEI